MSRAFVRRAELRRALLRAGPHVGSANRAGATNSALAGRPLSAQAPGLHQPPVGGRGGNSWRDRYHASNGGAGAAAVVVAGSVTLFVLSQLDVAEELLPSLSKKSGNNGGDASSPKRIEDFYALERNQMLGRGQFGTVSTATDKVTGEVVAVKCVSRRNSSETTFREETEAHREVGNHPNVVGLKGVFADDESWYMVMELAKGGELYHRLTTEGVLLEDEDVRSLLRETADAMAYMHDRGIVHGDIKPENMLLTVPLPAVSTTAEVGIGENVVGINGGEAAAVGVTPPSVGSVGSTAATRMEAAVHGETEGAAKRSEQEQGEGGLGRVLLSDFGSSFRLRRDVGGGGGGKRFSKEYTVAYSAPEVVTHSPVVDQKADVWSLGVIAYVMAKGYHPFDPTSDADEDEITQSIIHSDPDWDGLEPEAAMLIRQMLSRNPEDRPSAREVLESSWLQLSSQDQEY